MDVEKALTELRQAVQWELNDERREIVTVFENATAMAESFTALDGWLTDGGYLPTSWRTEKRR